MNDSYVDTSYDYLIQNELGKFYAMKKNYKEKGKIRTHFIDNPKKACVLFKEDAEEMVQSFNDDPNMIDFTNCIAVKRDDILKEYDENIKCV